MSLMITSKNRAWLSESSPTRACSNRLLRRSRQNRNSVIGLLRHRYTLIAEPLEGFGRELRPLQFLQQQYIRFANLQPCRDMGQPRANRIQIPASDLKHQSTF